MVEDLVVIGTGGLDIIRLIEDINAESKRYNFLGFLEKDPSKVGKNILGYPVLGSDELLLTEFKHCSIVNNVMHNPRIHQIITNKLVNEYGVSKFPNLVHPTIDLRGVEFGQGNIVYVQSHFGPMVRIGDFNIMYAASLGHESIIGSNNLFSQVKVGSRCKIGSFNLFGNCSTVSNMVKIGDDNTIGVGSVVIKNVKNQNHLLGYPAININDFIYKYMSKK